MGDALGRGGRAKEGSRFAGGGGLGRSSLSPLAKRHLEANTDQASLPPGWFREILFLSQRVFGNGHALCFSLQPAPGLPRAGDVAPPRAISRGRAGTPPPRQPPAPPATRGGGEPRASFPASWPAPGVFYPTAWAPVPWGTSRNWGEGWCAARRPGEEGGSAGAAGRTRLGTELATRAMWPGSSARAVPGSEESALVSTGRHQDAHPSSLQTHVLWHPPTPAAAPALNSRAKSRGGHASSLECSRINPELV